MFSSAGSGENSVSSIQNELKLFNCVFGKTRQRSVSVVKCAGGEFMDDTYHLTCFRCGGS